MGLRGPNHPLHHRPPGMSAERQRRSTAPLHAALLAGTTRPPLLEAFRAASLPTHGLGSAYLRTKPARPASNTLLLGTDYIIFLAFFSTRPPHPIVPCQLPTAS